MGQGMGEWAQSFRALCGYATPQQLDVITNTEALKVP